MDCVGCDRCRMWGKIQTIGYGTALKILFEDDENNQSNLKFRRIEIVALINTFDRLSKSIAIINNFKQMYIQHLQDVVEGKHNQDNLIIMKRHWDKDSISHLSILSQNNLKPQNNKTISLIHHYTNSQTLTPPHLDPPPINNHHHNKRNPFSRFMRSQLGIVLLIKN